MSSSSCGSDCWLRKDPPSPASLRKCSLRYGFDPPNPKEVARELYRPLMPLQTRLAKLEAGPPRDRLTCQLLTVEISDDYSDGFRFPETFGTCHYEALSYTWGKPEYSSSLQCNDLIYPITPNLAAALQALRHPYEARYLWIDAVCINQYDDSEKSTQIGKMFSIYKKASNVIAWVGEELPWTAYAFQMVRLGKKLYAVDHAPECEHRMSLMFETLNEMFKRQWFRRTWIRQEVFAAQRVTVKCGFQEEDFRTFLRYVHEQEIPNHLNPRTPIMVPGSAEAKPAEAKQAVGPFDIKKLLRTLYCGPDLTQPRYIGFAEILVNSLEDGTFFEASDPRDFVYGILGLVSNMDLAKETPVSELASSQVHSVFLSRGLPERREFPVSYSKSVSEVYQDVMRYVINSDDSLCILERFDAQEHRDEGMPSWTIDWREGVRRSLCHLVREPPHTLHFFRGLRHIPNSPGRLLINGCRLGSLRNVYCRWTETAEHWIYSQLELGENLKDGLHALVCSYYSQASVTPDRGLGKVLEGGRMLGREHMSSLRATTNEVVVQRFALAGDLVVLSFANSFLLLLRPMRWKQYRFLGAAHVPTESYSFLERLCVLENDKEIPSETFHLV